MTLRAAYGIVRGDVQIAPFTLRSAQRAAGLARRGIAAPPRRRARGSQIGEASPIKHATYQGLTIDSGVLFCAAQARGAVRPRPAVLRAAAYFSRVLTRFDYALGADVRPVFLAVLIMSLPPALILTVAPSSLPRSGHGITTELNEDPTR